MTCEGFQSATGGTPVKASVDQYSAYSAWSCKKICAKATLLYYSYEIYYGCGICGGTCRLFTVEVHG